MTSLGPVRGILDTRSQISRFLGIPYAAPPVGPLRFRAPQPALAWTGPFDATRFGPAAAQPFDPHEAPLEEYYDGAPPSRAPRWVGSEDCLTLNVWTRLSSGKRPVLVWIHGGANWLEGSRLSAYDGAPLAEHGDLVVFSINYRLGIFGFLDVSVLGGADYAGSHSLGIRDQLAAIDWIAANASAFGGDPSNITLMGESAGSMDISWLLTTGRLPLGVRRAFLMSGIAGVPGLATHDGYSFYSESEGQRQARELLTLLGIDSMSALLSASTDALLERLARELPHRDVLFYWDSLFYPRVDGKLIPQTPFEYVAAGHCRDRPLLIGWTANELGLWTLWDPELDRRTTDALASRLPGLVPGMATRLAKQYLVLNPQPDQPGMQLLADAMFVMPSLQIAESQARAGGKAWVYEFAWEVDDPHLKATHAADVGFFLGTFRSRGVEALIRPARDSVEARTRVALASTLMKVVISFATHGEPGPLTNGAASLAWPEYQLTTRPILRLNAVSELLYDPFSQRRDWWARHVYAGVSSGSGPPA